MTCPRLYLSHLILYIFSVTHRDEVFVNTSDSDSPSDVEMISQPVFTNRSLAVRRSEQVDRRSVSSRLSVPPPAPPPVEESIVPAPPPAGQRRSGTSGSSSRRNQRHSALSRVSMQ
jgi:hypothetical protein